MTPQLRKKIFDAIYLSDNYEEAFKFLFKNPTEIQKYYESFNEIFHSVAGGVTSKKMGELFVEFIALSMHLYTQDEKNSEKKAVDLIETNLRWLGNHGRDTMAIFEKYNRRTEIDIPNNDTEFEAKPSVSDCKRISSSGMILIIGAISTYFNY